MFQQEINKQRKTLNDNNQGTLEQNQVFWARESLLSTNNRSGKETPHSRNPWQASEAHSRSAQLVWPKQQAAWYMIEWGTQNKKVTAINRGRKVLFQLKHPGSVCSIPYGLPRALFSRRVLQVKEETMQVRLHCFSEWFCSSLWVPL